MSCLSTSRRSMPEIVRSTEEDPGAARGAVHHVLGWRRPKQSALSSREISSMPSWTVASG